MLLSSDFFLQLNDAINYQLAFNKYTEKETVERKKKKQQQQQHKNE
jgi:hypothetical protein